jgi:DNA modification methylase
MEWPIDYLNKVICGDCIAVLCALPDESVNCCITSPPYWGLRDYGVDGQLGLEKTPEEYVYRMVEVFREVRRVLKDDGTLWLNLGDSYASSQSNNGGYSDKSTLAGFSRPDTKGRVANENGEHRKLEHGCKPKDLVGIPWLVAFALRSDGWYLRQDIIWAKPNPMPESVTDRCTKNHEYIFMLSKSARYFYDQKAIKEPVTYSNEERYARIKKNHKSIPDEKQNGLRKRKDKQRGHGRRYAGFNNRWDEMTKTEQCSAMRNKRDVWTVATQPFKKAHFATFPPKLIEPCILAGCPEGGIILDPFGGSGTSGMVAKENYRNYILIDLKKEYTEMADKRIAATLVNKKLEFK